MMGGVRAAIGAGDTRRLYGKWVPLGPTKKWVKKGVKEFERPMGEGCKCTGQTVPSTDGKANYMEKMIGGHCAYQERGDAKPWCFVKSDCAGAKKSNRFKKKHWYYCKKKDAMVPAMWTMLSGAKSAKMKLAGKVQVRFVGKKNKKTGRRGLSKIFDINMKSIKYSTWTKQKHYIPLSLGAVEIIRMRYLSKSDAFTWHDYRARFRGGYMMSYTRDRWLG